MTETILAADMIIWKPGLSLYRANTIADNLLKAFPRSVSFMLSRF